VIKVDKENNLEKLKKELEFQRTLTAFYKDLSVKLQSLVDNLISR